MSTILVVDDDANVAKSVMRLLQENSLDVLTATTAHQALELLKTKNDISVVISDQRMPSMQGTDLFSEMQNTCPLIKRILLTGYTDTESLRQAVNHGDIFRLVLKPWHDEELINFVQEAIITFNRESESHLQQCQLDQAVVKLEQTVMQKNRILNMNIQSLQRYEKIVDQLPIGIICVGDDDMIALANGQFCMDLNLPKSINGTSYLRSLPKELHSLIDNFTDKSHCEITLLSRTFHITKNTLHIHDSQFGKLLSIRPIENEN